MNNNRKQAIFFQIVPSLTCKISFQGDVVVSLVSVAVETVLKSLDDPQTAGLILEEQANALKSILGDASVLKLIRVSFSQKVENIF